MSDQVMIDRKILEGIRQRLISMGAIDDFGPELFQALNIRKPVSANPAGEVPEVVDERALFDQWFRRDQLIADSIDTTFISAAFLPYRAWAARARIVAALQARAVVMPERMAAIPTVKGADLTAAQYACDWYNRALDEVARLNGKGGV